MGWGSSKHGSVAKDLTHCYFKVEELRDLRDNGPFPVEMRCHHCSTVYTFSREEIHEIYGQRLPDN
jgi:hypothetical protein